MKLGIAAPVELVDNLLNSIKIYLPTIAPVFFPYTLISDLPHSLIGKQSRLDAILFLGHTALTYTIAHVTPTIPWKSVPRTSAALLRIFVQLNMAGYDMKHISTDLQSLDLFRKAYTEIGLPDDTTPIIITPASPYDDQYLVTTCSAHEKNYKKHGATCCITIFSDVNRQLLSKHIPSYCIYPYWDDIFATINQMELDYLLKLSHQSQLIVLAIQLDEPNEYSLMNDDEYQYVINRTVATRLIYNFARSIEAAVSESGPREYLLFATRTLAEQVTNHFSQITLLKQVQDQITLTISLGIGYGTTAWKAKTNARQGMSRASQNGGNQSFIVYSENQIIGPLHAAAPNVPIQKIDEQLQLIAEESGVSTKTLNLLNRITAEQGKTQFTPTELADLASLTLRSINRILAKLIFHGYCFEVGLRFHNTSGRPSRVVDLQLQKNK